MGREPIVKLTIGYVAVVVRDYDVAIDRAVTCHPRTSRSRYRDVVNNLSSRLR